MTSETLVGRVLVAGIGNIFQTDDGFGVEVANRLATRPVPDGVEVAEFGIRGVHLAYQLLDGYDTLILVDAVPMGEEPGTLAVIQPEPGASGGDDEAPVVDAHTMSPDVVLGTLAHLGGSLERVYVVGCQPADFGEGMGLTPAVAAAVDRAVDMCDELLSEILAAASTIEAKEARQ
jgi:hydrogenase maturation protease